MAGYAWENCPAATRRQIGQISDTLRSQLGDELVGLYLHGSLALGCFHPARSDLDLLAVTRSPLDGAAKRDLVAALLRLSRAPHPVEISVVRLDTLREWSYPPPFEWHYSESWRERYTRDLEGDGWRVWPEVAQVDPDLAAHVPVTRARGVCLVGAPIADVFPHIPAADYQAALLSDFADWRDHLAINPVYYILNACRIAGYWADGQIRSKAEGAEWALAYLPEGWRPLIAAALAAYQGAGNEPLPAEAAQEFMASIGQRIGAGG